MDDLLKYLQRLAIHVRVGVFASKYGKDFKVTYLILLGQVNILPNKLLKKTFVVP
jgi:hypothetical protein